MDIDKLRAYCEACLPEQWKALDAANRSKVISGNALVVQGHQMDVNAIVAFANAVPELLDRVERLQKDLDDNSKQRARLEGKVSEEHELYLEYYNIGHNFSIQLRHAQQERDAALAEVERLKGELQASRENEAMA